MPVDCDVLIVGAGVSGLTTAFRLVKSGFTVEVIERAPRGGGVIASERVSGVLCERGPNSILDTTPLLNALLDDLGIRGERIEVGPSARRRYVVHRGRLVPLPTAPFAFLSTPLFSISAKVKLLREPFVTPACDGRDESVSAFVTRRLGREVLDYAIEPFVAGIYAGNPDELSLRSAFPRLHELESRYGSLIRGQFAGARERRERGEPSRHVARSFSFSGGVQTLTDALARAVPVRSRTLAARVARADASIEVADAAGARIGRARAVVVATPAREAASLIAGFDADAARALEEIPYAAVSSVVQAYPRATVGHALDGFGFLAPRVEGREILGTLFSSSMFESRATDDMVVLTTYIGGRRQPELADRSENELARIAAEETAALLRISGEPGMTCVTRWPRAIPQYTLGHAERVARIASAERALPGVFLRGSYRGGVSVADCVKAAHATADAVAEFLRR